MSIYDDIQNSLGAQLERTAAIKADYLQNKTLEKKQLLNPGYGEFNPDEWDVIDGDTVKNKQDPNRVLRFAGPNGNAMDTFETWKTDPATGERYNPYDRDPSRAYTHKKAFARQLGKDIHDVSNQDLVEAGEAQAEHLRQNFGSLRGQSFTEDGQGAYGRGIARFNNPEAFDTVLKGVNAGYFSKYNSAEQLRDFKQGTAPEEKKERSFARALTGDALTSVAVGTGRMVSGLSQGVLNLLGANNSKGVNNFFNGLNNGLDNMNEYLSSDAKLQREGYDQKEQELLSTLWDVRKREYMETNPEAEEWQANLSAITDEAADRIEYLIENPGRILDASLESLPYMIGVGAVGRAVALKQTARLRGSFLKNMKTGTRSERALARPKNAKGQFLSDDAAVTKYMQSAEFAKNIKTATTLSGIGTVGLTEGFSNAADVYNSVNNMTEEEAMQSEKYQALRKQGMSHEDANAKLAKEAFNSTLVMTTLVAGVASAVTGAAGFESRLFTKLADRVPGKINPNNKLLKFAQETGKVAGSFTGPGTREAVEETIQSGGGELLGQVAEKNATGLGEIGPGVGRAAGEGGLVGLVSGAVAGGSGTAVKSVIKGGFVASNAVGKVLNKRNTKLDQTPITTNITDDKGKVGGSTLEARAELGKGEKTPEQLLNESLDVLKGDAEGAVLVNHIRTFIDAVAEDVSIPIERKEALIKKAKAAFDRAGAESTIQARSILKENTMEEIESNPNKREMLQILSMAQNYGQLKQEELHDGMGKYFGSSGKVADAVAEAEALAATTTQAEDGKTASQVFNEKMGEGQGLRGHVGRIDEAIENGDERGYFEADQDLLRFIKTQVQRASALEEMAARVAKGEPAEKVEAETNKKYGTELKWVPPDSKVERTNRKYDANILSGSLQLADNMRKELDKMIAARDALSEKAIAWNDQSPAIKKTAKAVVKENKTLNAPYIPGVSAEGRNAKEPESSRNDETGGAERAPRAKSDEKNEATEGNASKDSKTEAGGTMTPAEVEAVERAAQEAEDRLQTGSELDERNPPSIDEVPYIPGVTDTDAAKLDAGAGRGEEVEANGAGSQTSEASAATEATEAEDSASTTQEAKDAALPFIPSLTEASQSDVELTTDETQGDAQPKVELEGEALEEARRNVYELQRLETDGDKFTKPNMIRLTDQRLTWAIRSKMDKGMSATQAANEMLAAYETKYGSSVFKDPANQTDTEGESALLASTDELTSKGETKSSIMASFEPAIDLLSDTATKLLGLYVNKRKNPLSNWTEEELNDTRKAIKEKLRKSGLPSKITKALQLRDKMTNNLLAAVPRALTLLNNVTTRRAFARKVKANAVEEQGLNGVIDFVNFFIETLQDTNKGIALETLSNPDDTNSPFRRSGLGKDGAAVSTTLHEYALQYFFDPETGKIDENLAAIMAVEAGQWLATGGASTLNNRNDTINDLIGRPRGTELGEMDRLVFGNGTLMSNVVSKIGQRVLSQAGLSLNGRDVDPLFLDELHSSIGTMALATMQQMNLVKIVPVTAAARDFLSGEQDAQGVSNENFNLVHIAPAGQHGQARFEESGANKDIRLAYNGANRILKDYFSAVSYVQGPILEPSKSPSMVSRALTKIPMAQRINMGNNSKYAWRPIKGAIALLDQFADEHFEKFILESEDAENTQVNLREGVESKAASNARSLRQVREWVSENGANPFYFAYRMIRSGRIYIDSSGINPQADKLHRFVFAMDDWKVTMKTTNTNPSGKTYENFLLAVGLGMNVDSSKLSRKQALNETKQILAGEDVQKVIELLQTEDIFDEKQAELIASVLPGGEKAHGLVALKAYADYQQALADPKRDSITIALPMETDGKTNGFASSALQTPPVNPAQMKQVMEMLRATGVYFDEDKFANYPEFAQTEGSLDNYQQVAQDTESIAKDMLNGRQIELDEPGNPKWEYYLSTIRKNRRSTALINSAGFIVPDRNFAKTPLMVVSYGAGYASVRRAIIAKALAGFYEDMGKATTAEEVALVETRLAKVVDGTNKESRNYKEYMAKRVAELKKEEDIREYALEYVLSKDAKKAFETGLDAVYGHALQAALEAKLGPMAKVRRRLNEATYLANLIYVKNFERQVAQQERILGRKLANRERELIVRKMIKQGMVPVVKAPNSQGLDDALETTSNSTEVIGGDRKGRASFRRPLNVRNVGWTVKDGAIVRGTPAATKSMVGSLLGYRPDMNVGVAALVKMIHSSDGAVNGKVMGKNAILNVHDAQVGNFNKIDEIANQANQTFYETHRDWNLAQETFDSLERLMPLLDPGDARLSAADKASINEDFMLHLQEYATESEKLSKLETTPEEALSLRNKWFRSLQKMVDHTNEGRTELFSKIKSVNQFAKEGHKSSPVEYTIPKEDRGVVNPKSATVVNAANNIDELMMIIRDQTSNAWAEVKRDTVTRLLKARAGNSDLQAELNDWMKQTGLGHAPAAEDMLDVLYEVFESEFANTEDLQRFRDMISILRPMLRIKDPETGKFRSVYVRLGSKSTMGTDEGQFRMDGNIYINPNAKDPIGAILHEIVHAANVKQLEKLQADGSPIFDELLKEATQWLKGARRAKEGSPTWAVYQEIKAAAEGKADRDLRIITEYIAYVGTTMNVNAKGERRFVFNSAKFDAVNAMARSLQSKSGTNVFYSSSENITESLFDGQAGVSLTADRIEEVFEAIKALEKTPVSSALQEHFNKILSRFIRPGLSSIDEVIVKMATNKNGQRNLGKWLNDPRESAIFLEATSQNYFTSAVDMSLQEVALHEMLHAIFETALMDPAISKEVGRLIESVQTQLTSEFGAGNEWKAFLPMDEAMATDVDKKLAKERYEHIFMNGEKSLQEFMAIGLTNPHFMEMLTGIDDRAPEKIFEGGLVNTLFNILERAIQFIRESIMGKEGLNMGTSLERLAERIIVLNAKDQAIAKDGEEGGWLTQKIASLNDAAMVKMASMVTSKLQIWAENNSMSGQDVKDAAKDKNKAAQLLLAARTATASTLDQNAMKGFREAFESAITGIEKDHWLYQMLTEVLPWADRNRGWIDALRNSEKMIDMIRQQKFEHTRTALMSYFDPKRKMSRTFRENVTRILMDTDIVALMEGPNAMRAQDLINILKDPTATAAMIEALTQDLEKNLTQEQFNLMDFQSRGLASYMVTGRVGPVHVMNVDLIVAQDVLDKKDRTKVKNAKEVRDTLERLTSLRAFQETNRTAAQEVISVMEQEMSRPVKLNGFTGLMGTATTFKKLSFEKLFNRNPVFMEKGYTSDITDPEIELKAVLDSPQDREAMRQQGYTEVKVLNRADLDTGPNMVLYKKKMGMARFSKAVMSLTGEQKHGTGMFDSAFATVPDNVPGNLVAAQVHNKIAAMRVDTQKIAYRISQGRPITYSKQVQVAPLFNEDREMMDFRYVMDKDMKREHLKKRDMFDEVVPRMMASIEDRTNTKVVNRGAIDLLFNEYVEARNSDNKDDFRFVAVGKDVASEQGRELWNLLPEDTKRYATSKFGAEVIYLRDDVVNLVLGFRKIAWSNNKFLTPAAPVVDVAEKIWLEVMQWVRYRIAVLTPAVVVGNMISNFALLLAQGIPPSYIYRQSKVAIIGMRKYQKDLRAMNELSLTVEALKVNGKNSAVEEQKLIRLKAAIANNPTSVLVEEGMFTSIVEEFGIDENSNRRQLTTKFLDKFGGITGAEGAVKVAQEAWMVPGSETGQMALMATQYGDFVGRFVQYNWNMRGVDVKTPEGKAKQRQVIHDALDTFIYYNVPQNRILQFLNDNGFMMFTKFFFRIQHINARIFKHNPVQASIVLGAQQGVSVAMGGNRLAEENIANYAFLNNMTNKFQTPWDHIFGGDILTPTFLKWIPDTFFGS